jgi:hypothetical protein
LWVGLARILAQSAVRTAAVMLEVEHLNELADEYNRELRSRCTVFPAQRLESEAAFTGISISVSGFSVCRFVCALWSWCTFENGKLFQSLSAPRRTDVRSLAQLACDLDVCGVKDGNVVAALVDLSKRLRSDAVEEAELKRQVAEYSSASQEARDTARRFRKCVLSAVLSWLAVVASVPIRWGFTSPSRRAEELSDDTASMQKAAEENVSLQVSGPLPFSPVAITEYLTMRVALGRSLATLKPCDMKPH